MPLDVENKRRINRECYLRNREKFIKRALAYQAHLKTADPDLLKKWRRNANLRRRYGIGLMDYERLLKAQGGRCAICRAKKRTPLHVDHDHKTGKVRGLLCFNCNRALGLMHDATDMMARAIAYLTRKDE